MIPRIDTSIVLSDKRSLAYAEYGDADGVPVFLFHGLPGSRLSWGLLPGNPFPPACRLIAPDRTGYGRSSPKLGRTHLDWVADIKDLADALGLTSWSNPRRISWWYWCAGLCLEINRATDFRRCRIQSGAARRVFKNERHQQNQLFLHEVGLVDAVVVFS